MTYVITFNEMFVVDYSTIVIGRLFNILHNFMSSRFCIKFCFFINFNIFSFKLVLLPWGPRGRAVKTLAANAGGCGFEPHRGQNLFSQFTLFNRVECEKLFCKTNLKLKVLKLIKTKFCRLLLKSFKNCRPELIKWQFSLSFIHARNYCIYFLLLINLFASKAYLLFCN